MNPIVLVCTHGNPTHGVGDLTEVNLSEAHALLKLKPFQKAAEYEVYRPCPKTGIMTDGDAHALTQRILGFDPDSLIPRHVGDDGKSLLSQANEETDFGTPGEVEDDLDAVSPELEATLNPEADDLGSLPLDPTTEEPEAEEAPLEEATEDEAASLEEVPAEETKPKGKRGAK